MRRDPALSAWLDDADAQAHGREEEAALARACARLPALAAFRAALAEAPEGPDGADTVDAAVARLFDAPGWCGALIDLLMAALAADPFSVPPQPAVDTGLHHGLVLHDDAKVSVALGVGGIEALARHKSDGAGRAIHFSGHRTRLRFLRAAGATIAFHTLDADGRARPAGRRQLRDGEGFAIDGRRATWIADHATGDLVILQATIKGDRAPLLIECDSASGLPIARSTNDEAASRTQLLVSLLAAMDRRDALPEIAACLAADQGFVRWHAMRELVALDPDAALPPLTAMAAGDADGEVRDAARATLALLGEDAPCRA